MTARDLRTKFLEYFENKGHKVMPSSSLIPKDDPSILLTTAGMQQFKLYFAGVKNVQEDFGGSDLVSIQKCFRTSDIDEVGDESHLTFFEMLGNFSIGGYGKKEAIEYAWELMTSSDWYSLHKENFFSTVFAGDGEIPADSESESFWKSIAPDIEVKKLGRDDNFWPKPIWIGTCGPSSELHYNLENGGLEIWNLVFTQYFHNGDGSFKDLGKVNIDTGMGLERLTMISQNKSSVFETDLFTPIIKKIEKITDQPYGVDSKSDRRIRIIADHIKASTFLIADGVEPSNKERGYILRRLIRRAVIHAKALREDFGSLTQISQVVVDGYSDQYPELKNANLNILEQEEKRFENTLSEGMKKYQETGENISGEETFLLFQSFGFPIELVEELSKEDGKTVDLAGFEEEFKKHQEASRAS